MNICTFFGHNDPIIDEAIESVGVSVIATLTMSKDKLVVIKKFNKWITHLTLRA